MRILRHCGLWEGTLATARAPPPAYKPRPAEPSELEVVLDEESLEFQRREKQQTEPGKLQLVLDERVPVKRGRGGLFCHQPRRSALDARLPQQNGAAGELPRFDLTIWALM